MRIEPLNRNHDRASFDCGNEVLNTCLQNTARQHAERNLSRTFVLPAIRASSSAMRPWARARSSRRRSRRVGRSAIRIDFPRRDSPGLRQIAASCDEATAPIFWSICCGGWRKLAAMSVSWGCLLMRRPMNFPSGMRRSVSYDLPNAP